jgi:outer membrane protein assembly factor BamB
MAAAVGGWSTALAVAPIPPDWPHFLGPNHNGISAETHFLHDWGQTGPKVLWEVDKGLGHGSPVSAAGWVIFLDRWQGKERVACINAADGRRLWNHSYEAPYRDRYGSGDGPRTSPTIAGNRVYTFGVTGQLHCLDGASGQVLWQHDCEKEFGLQQNFFGHGGSPLVQGEQVIVPIGGEGDVCAAAFDARTGEVRWKAKHEWGASYASPVPATFHGRECVLVFAGGESRPPTGGLLCLEAKTGQVLNATAHRARIAESVNASSPAVAGNRVFVTESYGAGGKMIEIGPDFSARVAWEAPHFGAYFMTPVVLDGCIIGCDGQSARVAELVAYDVGTGKELWRNDLGGKFGKTSLLAADGGVFCLGEFGDLAWLKVSREGVQVVQKAKLFHAPETWSMPVLAGGLLLVNQNERSQDGKPARVICYDLREAK